MPEKKTALRQRRAVMDLKKLLRKYGCSRWRIARYLKIPIKTVSDWCNGIGAPDAYQAVEICKLLTCDFTELYQAILRTGR